ncbi:MAG: hypothetical protein ACPGQL_09150 [Thermoplasmatota archaeon]
MNKAVIALVGMMMLTVALPTNAADAREMNHAFLVEQLGENFDPEAYYPAVDVVTGHKTAVTGTAALNMLLDELDQYSIDLVALQTAAGLGNGAAGAVIELEIGTTGCDFVYTAVVPEAALLESHISKTGTGLAVGAIAGPDADAYTYSAYSALAGTIGGFCINFFGIGILIASAFPGAHVYDVTGAL